MVRVFSTQPMLYCKNISNNITTIRQALDTENPIQLSEWKREAPDQIRAVLIKFIEGSLEYFSFKRTDMSPQQIVMIVNDIMEKYYYFRLEDVCLCFKKGRIDSGYRKFYGRVDGSVFLEWFAKYDKERENVVQSHPSNNLSPIDLSNGVPFEQYEEDMLARMAGGDLYANEQYMQMKSVQQLFAMNMGAYKNYQYNRKHRFDNRK